MDTLKLLLLEGGSSSALAQPLAELLAQALDVDCEVRRVERPPVEWDSHYERGFAVVLVVFDQRRAGQWIQLMRRRSGAKPVAPILAVLPSATPEVLASLLKSGFSDYVVAPLTQASVLPRVLRFLPEDVLALPATTETEAEESSRGLDRLIGRSAAFIAEVNKLPAVARCDRGVLIEGETGTGKEVFARAIHELSPRAGKPFVPVNCGAIPLELAESELFGHERGAFTGAYAARLGLVAQAEGGTLFLDEVSSLPLLMQVKLLRFLQEREYRPVGSTAHRAANVRVIAAANIQLEAAVKSGQFRQDLFYRLNIVRVKLPALRHRREDILLLAKHFLRRYAEQGGLSAPELDLAAGEKLLQHSWPGNVRELEHVMERAAVFAEGGRIRAAEIALDGESSVDLSTASFKQAKARMVADFERSYIEGLLVLHRGNISHAARRAGKNRRAFFELIRKHGVDAERFRPVDEARVRV